MEKCIGTLKSNTNKKEMKTKSSKKKKTSENRNLILDLNNERARKQQGESNLNRLVREIQEEKLKIKRIELEQEKLNASALRGGSDSRGELGGDGFFNRPKSGIEAVR